VLETKIYKSMLNKEILSKSKAIENKELLNKFSRISAYKTSLMDTVLLLSVY
jgi:hypothetical protein